MAGMTMSPQLRESPETANFQERDGPILRQQRRTSEGKRNQPPNQAKDASHLRTDFSAGAVTGASARE